jgi:hypothetical protein
MRVGRWGRASILLGAGTPRPWNDLEGTTFSCYLLLIRRENRNRLAGSRISISCTKSVIESRSSTRSLARLVVPKISHFHPGLLDIVGRATLASWQVAWHCKIPFELSSDPH